MEVKGVGCVQYTNPDSKKDEWIITLDLAYLPNGMTLDAWLKHLNQNKIAIVDSFKKGEK